MDFGTVVFAGSLTLSDLGTTKLARSVGGTEVGMVKGDLARSALQFGLVSGVDCATKRWAPKMKWPVRVAMGVGFGVVVVRNVRAWDQRRR